MNWIRSSFCSGGACVEVRLEHGAVYVRAAKQTRPDGQHWGPVQVWTLEEWRGLLRCVKVGWRPDGVYEMVDGCVEMGLDRHDDKLSFDADDWKAFTEGVINEEFEPEKLSSPAGGFRGSEPSAGRVVEPPAQLDQAATGAEVDRRDTAPVAAQPLDDELDLLISSAPAVAEERPVTGDRSEAGTGTSPGPVPAAEQPINFALLAELATKPHPLLNIGDEPSPWWGEVHQEARNSHHLLDMAGIPRGKGYASDLDARTYLAIVDIFALRERLDRIATWHSRETADGGMVGDYCVECGELWPCDTRRMAVGEYGDSATDVPLEVDPITDANEWAKAIAPLVPTDGAS